MRRCSVLFALAILFFACKSGAKKNGTGTVNVSDTITPLAVEKISDKDLIAYKTKLTALFDSNLISRNFNGGVIVAKGGNILYENYIGFSDPKTKKDPITDSTAFHLASTSKPFTGMAVLKLVQAGKLNLENDIRQYFPNIPYAGITIRDLLSHRSGLPNYLYFMADKQKWPADKRPNNNDVLNFLTQYQPALNYKPGTHFSYCNTNFVLLALILEKVTGTPYPEYMRNAIFQPLGMKHTFVYTPADSGHVIFSYKPSGAIWEQDIFDNTYGDKNIYSTPRDLVKWDAALYNPGFIDQTLLDSAFEPQSHETPSIHNYGLAWRMLDLPNGKKVIYHNGKWHGFTPAFARLLDEKAVIIILGNQYNNNIYGVAKLAYNVFGDYIQAQPEGEEDAATITATTAVPNTPKQKREVGGKNPQNTDIKKQKTSRINVQPHHVNPSKKMEPNKTKKPVKVTKTTPFKKTKKDKPKQKK